MPTVITPNGDGLNDTFRAAGLYAPAWQLQVFNRWGRRVFAQEHYDNGWGGQAGTAGTYYYVLTNPVTGEHYKGVVQVLP